MYQLVHLTSLPDLATIYLGRKNLQPVEKKSTTRRKKIYPRCLAGLSLTYPEPNLG